ncbi:MAG: DUF4344 domain-containing metallopeptidase [Pseudomonadota bacterium]
MFALRSMLRRVTVPAIAFALVVAPLVPARAQNAELSADDIEEVRDFLIGNAISILFHETGHMLVTAYNLPVLGREEDAVDNLATLLLMDWDTDEGDQALIDSADAWFLSDVAGFDADQAPVYYGEHGLDRQRAYQIVCLMVGGKPDLYGDFADEVEMPKDRQQRCQIDYTTARESWDGVLYDYLLDEDAEPSAIFIHHDDAPEALIYAKEILEEESILEDVADYVAGTFDLPFEVTYVAAKCDQANAFWNPADRIIVLCYELIDFYADLIIKDITER